MGNKVSITLEDGTEETLKNGETLAEFAVMQGDGVLRDKADGSLFARQNQRIPNGAYTFIRKKPRASVYTVTATIKGGFSCKGARGNVYKILEQEHASFSQLEGRMVSYTGNDLSVKAYFRTWDRACNFQTRLNNWEEHKELVNLDAVETQTPTDVVMPDDLERFLLSQYDPSESESPCHTLADLKSYHWSVPLTEQVEDDSPLAKYQCLDAKLAGLKHIKCHVHSKQKNKKLQTNESNMIAASWPFHQMMDGFSTTESIPLLRLSCVEASQNRFADFDGRFKVTVQIEFRHKTNETLYRPPTGAKKVNETTWETVVYVKDKEVFQSSLAWKYDNTTKAWTEYDHAIEQS